MTRQMVDSVLSLKEYNRFSKGIFSWVGYKTKWLEYENIERAAGTTKWSFFKLFLYSLESIVAFSTVPLSIASVMGILFCFIAFVLIILIIVRTLTYGDPTSGWPSMACIMFFIGGVQLLCTGIIGQYLSKAYLEVKGRPIYIAAETEKDLNEKLNTLFRCFKNSCYIICNLQSYTYVCNAFWQFRYIYKINFIFYL